ncbi:unnamed protein product [Colias eurytheme]|nr:unnamed protein product [Colias eurytheme]
MDSILGGHNITIDQAPYQANYGDICGAVIIHKQWLLTSAHCGSEYDFIRVGSKYRKKGPKIYIEFHHIHPMYGYEHKFDYDIQLLELKRGLRFGRTVSAIKISDGACGDNVNVCGWGYPKEKGTYQEVLQRVDIEIVPLSQCQTVQNRWYNHSLTNRMFCAGDSHGDACQGDSGGSAVSYSQLVGISSFGYGCGRHTPGVYANVSSPNIRIWIRSVKATERQLSLDLLYKGYLTSATIREEPLISYNKKKPVIHGEGKKKTK